MDDAKAFGLRLLELRGWRGLTLREAAGLAGLSFSFWGQVERGEKVVNSRKTLEAMAGALRVHPRELTDHPWESRDPLDTKTHAGLKAVEIALERYRLGVDPEVTVRPWRSIQADLDRLARVHYQVVDYTAAGELAAALIGELQSAYVRLTERRREILLGLIDAHRVVMRITKDLGDRGLPIVGVHAVEQCAEMLEDPAWLGCAVVVRGYATGELDWAAQYRRSVVSVETLTGRLDASDALQACGMLHLSAALAAGAQADYDTSNTHLAEAAALAARMDTEVGTWANLWFGSVDIGNWRTSLALNSGEHGQALEAAKTVRPELLPKRRQIRFWCDVGRAFAVEKKTREKAVRVLVHAEQMAPEMVHHDVLVREVVSGLLRQALSEVGRRELRALAWRMGLTPDRGARPAHTGSH